MLEEFKFLVEEVGCAREEGIVLAIAIVGIVKRREVWGTTAMKEVLAMAAYYGRLRVVKEGLRESFFDCKGQIDRESNYSIAEYLIEKVELSQEGFRDTFVLACWFERMEIVKSLLEKVESGWSHCSSILGEGMVAVLERGTTEIVEIIVKSGLVEKCEEVGWAYKMALEKGDEKLAEMICGGKDNVEEWKAWVEGLGEKREVRFPAVKTLWARSKQDDVLQTASDWCRSKKVVHNLLYNLY
ncbi:hypothetical protein BC829DRAFT_394430 [Chytridium lagenaria]|nr:hypothetical protein BC829DRAFT_394430 [Chytridium lagenaria]